MNLEKTPPSIPKQVAQFLWVGAGLSPLENLCLRSFTNLGYEVHLYSYGPLDLIPDGVVVKDAGEIIPEDDAFFGPHTCDGKYANFSDRFRYYLLFERGGWWFDSDHVALKLLPEPGDLLIASQWEGEHGEYACPGALWCKPGDPRMKWLKERCDEILSEGGEREYTKIGPMLVNDLVREFSLKENVAPWWEFNPYPYFFVNRLVYRTNREWLVDKARFLVHLLRQATKKHFRAAYVRPGSRAIHLANEIWRANGIDKNLLYHPGCIYGKLQRKHGFVAPADGSR